MFKPKGVMFLTLVIMLMAFSCSGPKSDQPLLKAKLPLHLEDHLDAAYIEGSEVPKNVLPAPVEWRFDEPQPGWKPAIPINQTIKPVKVIRTEDALRVILNESNFNPNKQPIGGIYIDLPGWHCEHWAYILVRARTSEKIHDFSIGFNLREQPGTLPRWESPFRNKSEWAPAITDGSVQTYLIRADYTPGEKWEGQWQQLGIWFHALEPASIDILSVKAIPKEALYSDVPVGLSTEVCNDAYRRTLFSHTPGKLEYRVKVPKEGRFDVGLGVLRGDIPITFKIAAIPGSGEEVSLLEEVYSDKEHWAQRSVDLSDFGGKTITLKLEAEAERAGTVSLWAAPTLSGKRATTKPNIILYIIDGASADYMSVYGYNRRTTPNIERLAGEGAVFEHAYSNATWTKVSNPSFMTSQYISVLGGYTGQSSQLPSQAITMAQLMHDEGYQTGVFTTNSYCGTMSGFNQGVDWLREKRAKSKFASARELHKDYWEWRKAHPGQPYWVHFQTTDLHWPWEPEAPFAGLFLSPESRLRYFKWEREVAKAAGLSYPTWPTPRRIPPDAFKKAGINHLEYFENARCLNDEAMAHNDYQLGKLVERLKESGEWEHTLLIIAADHGSWFGIGFYDPIPPLWGPSFRSYEIRIPMIFVWPGHIAPGQRLRQPVSLIDMLPTVLDLADIPAPEGLQGRSLAPLLLGEEGWQSRPIIFDEFYVDPETGGLLGKIEVIDGRWGASLDIDHRPDEKRPQNYRLDPTYSYSGLGPPPPFPVLIYDVWEDPNCLVPLNEKRPDLVEKYTEFLEAKWKEHQELAKRFSRSTDVPLTPEQLRTLRSLGYIR
jgi:arylsulfatase A-like enzyme